MKINIGSEYFETAKHQAHVLRNTIIEHCFLVSFEELHTKAAFLNTWAECLGYENWGEFQAITKNAHKDNPCNTIITPNSIRNLAKLLCLKSYVNEAEIENFESALFLSTLEHERRLFCDADIQTYTHEVGTEANPILFELGPDKHQRQLVNLLFNHHIGTIDFAEIEKDLLKHAKAERAKHPHTPKGQFTGLGLDIYHKSGTKASSVVAAALKSNWVEQYVSFNWNEPKTMCRLSQRAIDWLFGYLTDDYSPEWLAWNRSVDKAYAQSSSERRLENIFSRIKAYSYNHSPESVVADHTESYITDSPHDFENGEYLIWLYPKSKKTYHSTSMA